MSRPSVDAPADILIGPLEPTGPRGGADSGEPMTATRILHASDDGQVVVGIWECTPGGWSIVDRPDTEVIHLLAGRARITDADGTVHDLAAGDAHVLPRGWSGRWDISETVRKLFVTRTGE